MTPSTPVDTDLIEADSSSFSLTREQFDAVLARGFELGYCSTVVCLMHDGLPLTEEEDEDVIEGHDPCVFAVRLHEE